MPVPPSDKASLPSRLTGLVRHRLSGLGRRRLVVFAALAALVLGLITWSAWPSAPAFTRTDRFLTVKTGPNSDEPVRLDTALYLPAGADEQHQVPAILLAHGFGGSKNSVATDAEDFAARGYAVLTWTAEGFGLSGGQIHVDSPDWEVRDAQQLLTWLADRPEVRKDAPGDPRVGVVGGSYGGGLALLLAAADQRVDAIVPMITWNSLPNVFLPDAAGRGPAAGVFKRQWAGLFFGSGGGAPDLAGALASTSGSLSAESAAKLAAIDVACGRFAADICAAYQQLATTGQASPATIDLLDRSSPARVLSQIKAPTLLIQGQADSLFPPSEAMANYAGIAAAGTPVRMDWFTGGHDGGSGPQADQDRDRAERIAWLDYYLMGRGPDPGTGFTYSRVSGLDAQTRGITTAAFSSANHPGADKSTTVGIGGRPQLIANPAGGAPAAISALPGAGLSGLASFTNAAALDLRGQHADFYSDPLAEPVDVVGTPQVQIRAASPTGEAVLFAKLYDVDAHSGASLPFGLVAPLRLSGLPATLEDAQVVTLTLPAIVHRFDAGHRLRLTLATTDQAYAGPVRPVTYQVGLPEIGGTLRLPTLPSTPITGPEVIWRYVLAGLVALLVAGLVASVVRTRRRAATALISAAGPVRPVVPAQPVLDTVAADPADLPLVVSGLRKAYTDGFVAVESADFTVHRGQVVGLLGPNGAGKTTTLRVLLGLIKSTAGRVLVFGEELTPGAAVLGRVGALVEGPGFLPHLSGRQNLEHYWRSTGRPMAQAYLDEALEIAGLGTAIDRKVRKYSHGMKQRLAIAQAMLGLPELLVLDEPTDGLDPPQIAQMRKVLRAYATQGRSVLVSSHLLAEVEQTCTHVVVMNRGQIVANGRVEEVVGESPVTRFEVSDGDRAAAVLESFGGVRSVQVDGAHVIVADLGEASRSQAVEALVKAGVGVDLVVPRRRLEDAFLSLVGADTKASGQR